MRVVLILSILLYFCLQHTEQGTCPWSALHKDRSAIWPAPRWLVNKSLGVMTWVRALTTLARSHSLPGAEGQILLDILSAKESLCTPGHLPLTPCSKDGRKQNRIRIPTADIRCFRDHWFSLNRVHNVKTKMCLLTEHQGEL